MKTVNNSGQLFVVVAYDISDDRRRARLHRRLKKYGLAVQYSVFECLLNANQIREMKSTVNRIIRKKSGDRVRYYALCESCRQRIEATDEIIDPGRPAIFI